MSIVLIIFRIHFLREVNIDDAVHVLELLSNFREPKPIVAEPIFVTQSV